MLPLPAITVHEVTPGHYAHGRMLRRVKGDARRVLSSSAFVEGWAHYAEELFVEEGFRIRFNNGEVIDFYADTAWDKEEWMRVLSDVIGSGPRDAANGDEDGGGGRGRSKWCELVLKREEALGKRAEGRIVDSRTKSMYL